MKKTYENFDKFKDFPKNFDHVAVEEKIKKFWEEDKIYTFNNGKGGEKPIFSVDTPPPYVSSAHLHVGHVMSYSQAEFIVRYKRMKGFNIFYPMGFDDNGLPTERYVEKKYKVNKAKITREEFIDLCLKETKIGIETYKSLWKSAGISVDYGLSFSTIDERCRKTAQKSFIDLYRKSLIERRNDPIQWCPQCRTALAQADIIMEEFDGVLYDVEFKSEDGIPLIISTTRPELLGACVAIYANPKDERYGFLNGKSVITPIYDKSVPVKFDDAVDMDYGSGLMMVCTWGDIEDVKKWKEHKLDTLIIVDKAGRLNEAAGQYAGLNVKDAKKNIAQHLKSLNLIKGEKNLVHNVGVHDRCETPVEFIQAYQWFIKILDNKNRFIKAADEINWRPEFMKQRYIEWVNNLKWEWNISRQRFYGVPFPVWYCSNCGETIIASVDKLPVDPITATPGISKCPQCGGDIFEPERDVMDTWMTSSLTPLINGRWGDLPLDYHEGKSESESGNKLKGSAGYHPQLLNEIYPMDLRPQAQEIIRTWLFYTVVKSLYHTGTIPFKSAMISGWGLDKNGKKMSKSLGNFVAPEDIIKKYSADALRYWASKANLGQDLRFSEDDVVNGRRLLTKIWNSARFLITNINPDFDPNKKDISKIELGSIDKWVISEFETTLKACSESMESYEYSLCLKAAADYFYNIYCDNYLEIIKNVFWDEGEENAERREKALTVMYFVSFNTLKIFAPFFPFITEELYLSFYNDFEADKSIHLSEWPEFRAELIDAESIKRADILLNILAASRKLRTSLNLHQNHKLNKMIIKTDNQDLVQAIESLDQDIKSAARVARVVFSDEADYQTTEPSIFIKLEN